MIVRLLEPAVKIAESLLVDTVPEDRIRSLLVARLQRGAAAHAGGDAHNPIAIELALAWELAHRAGVAPPRSRTLPPPQESEPATPAAVRQWINGLDRDRVVSRRGLQAGAGRMLLAAMHADDEQLRAFCDRGVDALLRHVEVRRRTCLTPVLPACSADEQWLERHDVTILLARYARSRRERRVLNSVLKVNDWAFWKFRRAPDGAVLARYLLALAEQESTVVELLS